MGKRKRKSQYHQKSQPRKESSHNGGIVFSIFLGTLIFAFYLWGKVQIDFVLRENDKLTVQLESLEREFNDLRIQVNTLKRYDRIVELANKQGMVFVSKSNLDELSVDVEEPGGKFKPTERLLRYAGMGFVTKE